MDAHDDLEEGESREMRGIGGWLLLFTLGRIIAVFVVAFALWKDLKVFVTPGVWQFLTDPGSEAYHALWGKLVIYETTGNVVQLIGSVAVAVLMFSNRKILPSWLLATSLSRFSSSGATMRLPSKLPTLAKRRLPTPLAQA